MRTLPWIIAVPVALACTSNPIADGPPCVASGTAETSCTDGADDDCDGYPDCLDSECETQSCGENGLMCTAGACVRPGEDGLPPLPRIDNVRVTMRGDTAVIQFEPIEGARDYRVYVRPAAENVLVGDAGEVIVRDAIYRCAGDRPFRARENDNNSGYATSLTANIEGYQRSESEVVLGYVYLTPGAGRSPVYRMADPNHAGGSMNIDWLPPPLAEMNAARYVVGTDERDRLYTQGFRDDGIVFYAPDAGTRAVYHRRYGRPEQPTWDVYFADGPEADARLAQVRDDIILDEQPFRVLDAPADGAVALHRVSYSGWGYFDVLAAGTPRYERALYQGNQPLWSLTWPGLTEATTLVIEALDEGCPFPGGYISATHADSTGGNNAPSITLDEARLASGEVYVNGQHDVNNRPRPIARALVDVAPEAPPAMDFYEDWSPLRPWVAPPEVANDFNNGHHIFRNDAWAFEFVGSTTNFTFGPVLGVFNIGCGDWGSSCGLTIMPRGLDTRLSGDRYLHARMSVDISSTLRRYPQIMITTTPFIEVGTPDVHPTQLAIMARIADFIDGGGPNKTILVQPFGLTDFQVQFCDERGWGVGNQCPRSNIYGRLDHWENNGQPWLPVPVMGERSGYDLPVQFDAYVSARRVYLFIDGEPAGCSILPEGRMPEGPVNVLFNAVGYHMDIDDPSDEYTGQQYLRRYSMNHTDRHFDDIGINLSEELPAWDEARFPCGSEWGP
jgi:hypothetical protein